ncbi:MAG TPA: pentapeptide repeat-containing protein [Luteimonas sp.]|nr:pentapeptide repeat-containing protein [Luteimonas sp.]
MSKRRVAISDDYGGHIAAYYLPSDSVDLENGNLEGFSAGGVSTLRGRSFAGSSLYWAMLEGADLSGCNFERSDLRGANLKSALLAGANLRQANLGLDNLGGSTRLQGADLTGAILNQCNLVGAEYDSNTQFPKGFDPESAGMINTD